VFDEEPTMTKQAIFSEAAKTLSTRYHPERIILFGSQARGTSDRRSDIDLLVIGPVKKNRLKMMVEMSRALAWINSAFDILLLTSREFERDKEIPGTLARYAAREGKVLYDSQKEGTRKKGKRLAAIRR